MENTTDKDTITSKIKVLAIGDQVEDTEKYPMDKNLRDSREDFRRHLGYLLLGTRSPIEIDNDWSKVGRFSASVHKKKNQPTIYAFHHHMDNSLPAGTTISGNTINGRAVMDEVKKRLSEENWISENEISTPLKAKLDNYYYNRDGYINQIVCNAFVAEEKRLFNYVLYLHRER